MTLFEIFETDGVHRRIIKHNKNLVILSGAGIFISENFLPLSGGTVYGNAEFSGNLSGNTIYSGGTDLSLIFAPISVTGGSGSSTFIQNGINTFTGGTDNNPTVNITSAALLNLSTSGTNTASQLSATTLSGGTILSGTTNINSVFAPIIHSHVQYATLSGTTFTGNINVPSLSATTLSGGTIYSGGTDLYNIFLTTNDGNDITRVQNGINTLTGGTDNNPTINIISASLNNLSVSGINTSFQFSSTTLSGGTILSGSTNLSSVFAPTIHSHIQYATLSGATFTSNINAPSLSATTLSGGTILSGTTDLSLLFSNINSPFTGNTINGAIKPISGTNVASGLFSMVAGGSGNTASGSVSFIAGGSGNTTSGNFSHVEGRNNTASANGAHAEGILNTASGNGSHVEGVSNTAAGNYGSHAGGSGSTASGISSFIHSSNSLVAANHATILGGFGNRLNAAATGSTILGGSNITGTTADTVYVPNLTATTVIQAPTISATTVNALNINLTNPGIGTISAINFLKLNDTAAIKVTEYVSDSTLYEFFMSDNPDTTTDMFHWAIQDFQAQSVGWKPLKFSGFKTQTVAYSTDFFSSFYMPGVPYYTTNSSVNSVNKYQPYTVNNQALIKDAGTGTAVVNVDVSNYNRTSSSTTLGLASPDMCIFWAEIDGVTGGTATFKWGTGATTNTAVATGQTITGSFQDLLYGVKIKIGTAGNVLADRWSFRTFQAPKMGLGVDYNASVAPFQLSSTVSASTANARGAYINPILIATANNDTLVGLDISPTFTSNSFTGVTNYTIRSRGDIYINNSGSTTFGLLANLNSAITRVVSVVNTTNTFTFGDTGANGRLSASGWTVDGSILATASTITASGLTITNSGSSIYIYNTNDQITNYERLATYKNANTFIIETQAGGTGTIRNLSIGTSSRKLTFRDIASSVGIYQFSTSTGAAGVSLIGLNGSFTNTSSLNNSISILNTINQSSTAGYRGIWISPFESTIGSGNKYFIDAGTNTAADGTGTHTSKFTVDNSGSTQINGSISLPYSAQTTTYSIKNTDYTIDCTSGTFTVTLPTAVGIQGKIYVIKNSGTGTTTVATTSSQTIDGITAKTISIQYDKTTVQSNGTNWIIL